MLPDTFYKCMIYIYGKLYSKTIFIHFRIALEKGLYTDHVLVLECDSGHKNGNLISCCRYRIVDLLSKDELSRSMTCILFLIHVPRNYPKSSFVSFQEHPWKCYHVDELISKPDSVTVTDLVIAGFSLTEAFHDKDSKEFSHDVLINIEDGGFYNTTYNHLFPNLLQYEQKPLSLCGQLYEFIPDAVSNSTLKRDRIQLLQSILLENPNNMGMLKNIDSLKKFK